MREFIWSRIPCAKGKVRFKCEKSPDYQTYMFITSCRTLVRQLQLGYYANDQIDLAAVDAEIQSLLTSEVRASLFFSHQLSFLTFNLTRILQRTRVCLTASRRALLLPTFGSPSTPTARIRPVSSRLRSSSMRRKPREFSANISSPPHQK